MSFTNLRQFVTEIDTKVHDDSMSFIQFYLFSILKHDMDFGQVQIMEFSRHLLRKCGISIAFGVIFNQTAVKKTWENIKCHIFYRVIL